MWRESSPADLISVATASSAICIMANNESALRPMQDRILTFHWFIIRYNYRDHMCECVCLCTLCVYICIMPFDEMIRIIKSCRNQNNDIILSRSRERTHSSFKHNNLDALIILNHINIFLPEIIFLKNGI